jgi:hypothetical protein
MAVAARGFDTRPQRAGMHQQSNNELEGAEHDYRVDSEVDSETGT